MEISFTLSEFDDVTVRIVDSEDRAVRNLASGVLGKNPPPPFRKNSLSQKILWDGNDEEGKPVTLRRYRVKVDVGMGAKLLSVHGNALAAAVGERIAGLAVDSKGDLYVHSRSGGRLFGIAVLHRDGSYARTFVPLDPRVPQGLLDLQDPLGHPYSQKGTRKGSFWRSDTEGRRIPRILNMAGYVRGTTHFAFWFYRGGLSLIHDDLLVVNGRYYLNRRALIPEGPKGRWTPKGWSHDAPCCTDVDGCAYHVVPEGRAWAPKPGHAVAKFAKFAREYQPDFTYAGRRKLDTPTHFLGEPHKPGDDDAHFKAIAAIATDAEVQLYVVDSGRAALRVFRRDGYYLGELKSVTVGGDAMPFRATHIALSRSGEIYALLAKPNKMTLIKLKNWKEPEAVWATVLDKRAAYIAIDENVDPRLLWIGNGAGYHTLTRTVDKGTSLGRVKTVGGSPVDALRLPGAAGIDKEGNGYIYDFTDGGIVCITPDGRFRRIRTMGRSRATSSMAVDAERGYLYVSASRWSTAPSLRRFTLEGKSAPFAHGTDALALRGSMTRGVATGPQGDIYVNSETSLRLSKLKEAGKAPGPFYVVRHQGDWGYSWAHVDVYDVNGKLKKTNHVIPICTGGVAVDSEGSVYTADTDICHSWGFLESSEAVGHTVKYGPTGGARQGPEHKLDRYSQGIVDKIRAATPAFARDLSRPPGMEWDRAIGNPRFPAGCGCATSYLNTDECDRIYVPESILFNVVVLDRAGNEMTRFGSYGNRDCAGPGSTIPEPEIAFMSITGVAARGDHIWVSDIGNSRALHLKASYDDTKTCPVP
ncbi:MAG: hypothetical protein AMS16_05245 [Planctomycetes bacterium DG_58]|nr:MAG: hypothetical protein AMS16_05245 [Planctomycetes bacterium DG_58]